jgi:hypothetical protein
MPKNDASTPLNSTASTSPGTVRLTAFQRRMRQRLRRISDKASIAADYCNTDQSGFKASVLYQKLFQLQNDLNTAAYFEQAEPPNFRTSIRQACFHLASCWDALRQAEQRLDTGAIELNDISGMTSDISDPTDAYCISDHTIDQSLGLNTPPQPGETAKEN